MTEYPVQCFDNNGEPYGRYVTLVNNENCHDYKERYGIDGFLCRDSDDCFCKYSEANTFPMPGAEIGKRYERGEVEVYEEITHRKSERLYGFQRWVDSTRQIFRLLPQPVEKEPETVGKPYPAADYGDPLSAYKHARLILNDSNFDQVMVNITIDELASMLDSYALKAIDWQKKQEASR